MASYRKKLVDKVIDQIIIDLDENNFEDLANLIKDLLEIEEARKAIERYLEIP